MVVREVGGHGVNGCGCGLSQRQSYIQNRSNSVVAGGEEEEDGEARIVAKVYEWYLCR